MLLLHTITNTQLCSKAGHHKIYFMQTRVYLERQEALLINYTHKHSSGCALLLWHMCLPSDREDLFVSVQSRRAND